MKVYALVGKSGTGKSFQAINLCKEKNIEAIIDDGLLVYKGKAIAGKSAKGEATKIGAVRRAIFNDEKHRLEVLESLKKVSPNSLLIIGTSEEMIEKISSKMEIEKVDEKINIEDITTESERKIAYKERHGHGKHIIPVPTMEIKRQFSGYFLSPMRIFKGLGNKSQISEKSVVRPTYSYMGNFFISEKVIGDIVQCTSNNVEGIRKIYKTASDHRIENMIIDVTLSVNKGGNIIEICRTFQDKCVKMIEDMTAFHIKEMNIEVKEIG